MNPTILSFAVSVAVLATSTLPCLAEESGYEGDITSVVTIDTLAPGGPYSKIWEPFIAQWSERHLVCAYGLQLTRKSDMGDIVCSVSRDGGKTWGYRTMIFDHRYRNGSVQYAYNNSVLFRPPGQDVIWLFAMRVPLSYRDSENARLVAAYSPDGGYSWNPVEIANDYQGALIIVGGITPVERDGQVHYLLPAHRNTRRHDPHGDRRQFVLESTSLLHWKLAGYVPFNEPDNVFLHEGSIAPIDDGRLQIVCRTATVDAYKTMDPPLAWSSTSDDGGRTWSTAQPEPQLPNYRSKAHFGRGENGEHIYVYSNDVARTGLYYKVRSPGGEWSTQRPFYIADNKNSYPTLIEDEPGRWLAVWDSSDDPKKKRTAIRFGRLNLGGAE